MTKEDLKKKISDELAKADEETLRMVYHFLRGMKE